MKTITIELDVATAWVVADMLKYFNLHQLKEAERLDPYKDNSPYIKAIENFLAAYEKATEK